MKKGIIAYFMFLVTIFILLSGCSSSNENSTNVGSEQSEKTYSNEHSYHADNGDLREVTNGASELPPFMMDKHEDMQKIYMASAQHQELLEYIPCYCGCADSGDHQSALNCFVYESKENGEVVWDDHGTRCGVCLETAAESINQYRDGKTIKEIRDYIDEKYKEGFSKPTPTKYPEA